jgi:hypothetical protein
VVSLRQKPYVVVVLEPTVRETFAHDRLVLLGERRHRTVGKDARTVQVQQCRVVHPLGIRNDSVVDADVELQSESAPVETAVHHDPDSRVRVLCVDLRHLDLGIEHEPVVGTDDGETLADDSRHGHWRVVDVTKEVDVARRASERSSPGTEHDGALDDESLSPLRLGQSIQEPLDREVLECLVKRLATRLRFVQQSCMDRRWDILQLAILHSIASRYGRTIFAT